MERARRSGVSGGTGSHNTSISITPEPQRVQNGTTRQLETVQLSLHLVHRIESPVQNRRKYSTIPFRSCWNVPEIPKSRNPETNFVNHVLEEAEIDPYHQ